MIRRTLAAAALASLVVLVPASGAQAAVSDVGWWTRNPAASAPDGGIQVANAPDGVVSFGAVRITEDAEDVQTAALVLKEDGQGLNASGAALEACPALGTWTAGKGTLAGAPKADCDAGRVALTRNEAGEWTGDVTAVLVGSRPAVAIVPAADAGVFQVSFAAPAITITPRASAGRSGASSTFDASEFTSSPATSASSSSSSSGDTGTATGSAPSTFEPSESTFTPSGPAASTFSPTSDVAAAATPESGPIEAAAADSTPEASAAGSTTFTARPAAAPPLAAGGNRWAQFGAFLAVAAIIGTAAGFGRNRLLARTA